jgi:hypothetical protein
MLVSVHRILPPNVSSKTSANVAWTGEDDGWCGRREQPWLPTRSRATRRELLSPQALPEAPGHGDQTVLHGLGWDMKDGCGTRVAWKSGGLEGYTALVQVLPQHGVALVSMSNGGAPLWRLHARVLDALQESGGLVPHELRASPALERTARAYADLYRAWSDGAWEATFGAYFRSVVAAGGQRSFLERHRERLGGCRVDRWKSVATAATGTFELACERGRGRIFVQVDAEGKIGTLNAKFDEKEPEEPAAACVPPWRPR